MGWGKYVKRHRGRNGILLWLAINVQEAPLIYSLCIRCASSHCTFHTDSAEAYSQHAQSLDGTMGSSIPLYRSSEEEKRVTVIKAPHYPGIGPVDESGIPTAIRTVSHASQHARLSGSAHEPDKGWIVRAVVHSWGLSWGLPEPSELPWIPCCVAEGEQCGVKATTQSVFLFELEIIKIWIFVK